MTNDNFFVFFFLIIKFSFSAWDLHDKNLTDFDTEREKKNLIIKNKNEKNARTNELLFLFLSYAPKTDEDERVKKKIEIHLMR